MPQCQSVRANLFAVVMFAVGCASDSPEPDDAVPVTDLSTGSSCPEGSALSYESFGREFLSSYCLRCHSAAVSGEGRLAPEGSDFDELAAIRARIRWVDQFAAAGPHGEHMTMPPNGQRPTLAERTQLGEWLACGAPR